MTEDNVHHPRHYNSTKYETIQVIEDWALGFHLGNAVKYISRAGKKDPTKTVEDLEKAVWYVRRQIELLKAGTENREAMKPDEMTKHIFATDVWSLKIPVDLTGTAVHAKKRKGI